MQTLIFVYSISRNITLSNSYALIEYADLNNNNALYSKLLQSYKLHTIFIMNNLGRTTEYSQQLMHLPVINKRITSINNKNQEIR
jgi:hypothetical protein